jgi:Na+-transporting NADH:ubiquinone oxidoreductase subunit NqrC
MTYLIIFGILASSSSSSPSSPSSTHGVHGAALTGNSFGPAQENIFTQWLGSSSQFHILGKSPLISAHAKCI